MAATKEQIVAHIRAAAVARGIDPDVAVRVAKSEGLNANPADGWQSNYVKNGVREPSYGPFQLYMGGGLGNQFQRQTGLHPKDPDTVFMGIDFALDKAAQYGWSAWYGAKRVGISAWQGLKGAKAVGIGAKYAASSASVPKNAALKVGGTNDPKQVAALQLKLAKAGLYKQPIDGVFGKQTAKAVKAY